MTGTLGVAAVIAQLTNVGILATFLFHRHLITPFIIHIVNLIAINTILLFIYIPLVLPRPLMHKFLNENRLACAFMQYAMYGVAFINVLQDLVICCDRWLAYLRPIWYRNKKTKNFGIIGTMIAIAYFHLWYLPLNILNYTMPADVRAVLGCNTTPYVTYRQIMMLAICYLPAPLLYGSFPMLLMLVRRRRRRQASRSVSVRCNSPMNIALLSVTSPGSQSQGKLQRSSPLVSGTRARRKREEKIINSVVIAQFFLKLSAILVGIVPTAIVTSLAPDTILPCGWDSFYLNQYYVMLIFTVEPFVFLKMLPELREAFLKHFACAK